MSMGGCDCLSIEHATWYSMGHGGMCPQMPLHKTLVCPGARIYLEELLQQMVACLWVLLRKIVLGRTISDDNDIPNGETRPVFHHS